MESELIQNFLFHSMQYFSIICKTPEQLSFVRSFTDNPNIVVLKLTHILGESIDILITADELSQFKDALSLHNIDYTIIIEDVEYAVQQEAFQNKVARMKSFRTWSKKQSLEPFNYYARYYEASIG